MKDSIIKILIEAIVLDCAERILRFFLFFIIVYVFFNRIEGGHFFYEDFIPYVKLDNILIFFSVWLCLTFFLSRFLSLGSKKFDTRFKNIIKKHTGKSLGFRNCVYVSSSLVQFFGVIFLSVFLNEYLFIVILLSSVILFCAMLFTFPNALDFFYKLAVGQSQLILFIFIVILLVICEIYGFYLFTLKTALLIIGIKFVLLYFSRFLIFFMLAAKRRLL